MSQSRSHPQGAVFSRSFGAEPTESGSRRHESGGQENSGSVSFWSACAVRSNSLPRIFVSDSRIRDNFRACWSLWFGRRPLSSVWKKVRPQRSVPQADPPRYAGGFAFAEPDLEIPVMSCESSVPDHVSPACMCFPPPSTNLCASTSVQAPAADMLRQEFLDRMLQLRRRVLFQSGNT